MEWISVKERLPDQGGRKIVYVQHAKYPSRICFAKWVKTLDKNDPYRTCESYNQALKRSEKYKWVTSGFPTKSITHWMPLPKQPKE